MVRRKNPAEPDPRRNISTNTAAEEKKYAKTDQLILIFYLFIILQQE